jgi:tRNA dimethylallyltransferase
MPLAKIRNPKSEIRNKSKILNQKFKEKKRIIFIVGPTAVGKTQVAVELAKKSNAEIISCDSMQIYKGMDIITSKPSPALRKAVSHHLIDVVSAASEYNVSRYRREALKKVREIGKRGKMPLFVGGTGLYMSILMDGIFKTKSQNPAIRSRLTKQAQTFGSKYLHRRLSSVDTEAAAKIHPHDVKRIIRALEVFESTGQPISKLQKERRGLESEYAVRIFCLNMPRHSLYQRIEGRIDKMFKQGLISEVKRLFKSKLSRTAACAIGIKEVKGYLEGLYGLEEAKRLMIRNSCLYAKRQLTWFRKDKRIQWMDISDKEKGKEIARKIWKELC